MTIRSRWNIPVPRCSLQQWIFGSSRGPLASDSKILLDADNPDARYLTMAEYRLLAKRVALGLQRAGLRPGDRVLIFAGNSVWFPAVFLGVLMAGGIFTGANPAFVPRELAHQLRDSGASFLLASPEGFPVALEAAAEVSLARDRVYLFDPAIDPKAAEPSSSSPGGAGSRHWAELLRGTLGRAETWDWAEPADLADTTCCLNYSSGTTGLPKGVEISHYAYVANGEGVVHVERKAGTRTLAFLPMYHCYAQTYFVANFPRAGSPTYIMPTFDFADMLEHVERYRITSLMVVPPIVVALAKHPFARIVDLSSIELLCCGASPLGREAAEECERLWPKGNVIVRQGWGMTEVTCTCMCWDLSQELPRTSAVGELLPNCAARLVETTDGSEREITEPNRPGELWISGPNMMRGYWRSPAATAAAVVVDPSDGSRWLRTGDIAYVENYGPGAPFHIVDRLKELIKVRGSQVAPAELEALLLERPDVVDAAVVGVSVRGEELPRAYVVPAAGATANPDDIASWFATKVAKYKQLKGGVVFTNAIPKNPSGKILRKTLRERARAEVGDRAP